MDKVIAGRWATEPRESEDALTVVVADDHAVVREGIKLILEGQLDVDVVAEAEDVDATRAHVLESAPSLLLLDLNMPGGSSLELIPEFLERSPQTRTVILTMQANPAFAAEALAVGARGYVLKQSAAADLVEAIRIVLAGDTFVSPELYS
jgi:two-component system response regulator NreC